MTDTKVTSSEHIRELSERIVAVTFTALKIDSATGKKRDSLKQALFDIALDCVNRIEFTAATHAAEHDYKEEAKVKRLPPSFVQARSDIKTMYDEEVAFRAENGSVLSFATAYKLLGEKKKAGRVLAKKNAMIKAAQKAEARSEEEKTWCMVVESINQIADRGLWNDCNSTIHDILQEYLATHPDALQKKLDTAPAEVVEDDDSGIMTGPYTVANAA